MTATIGRRRLDLTGERIEAVCASHKVRAHCWGGVVRRRGKVVFVVSTNPAYDLRKLQDDIALSLGVPVRAFRDAVVVQVLP